MKYSIDDLRKLQPIDNTIRNIDIPREQAALPVLQKEKDRLDEAYITAFSEKNIEAASEAKAKSSIMAELIKAKEAEINSLEEEAKSLEVYSREDIKKAWNAYITESNTVFKAKYERFLSVRKELAALFLELAEIQRHTTVDALHVNRLYSETNVVPEYESLASIDSDLIKPETIDKSHYTEERAYIMPGFPLAGAAFHKETVHKDMLISALAALGEIPADRVRDLEFVIERGWAVDKPF